MFAVLGPLGDLLGVPNVDRAVLALVVVLLGAAVLASFLPRNTKPLAAVVAVGVIGAGWATFGPAVWTVRDGIAREVDAFAAPRDATAPHIPPQCGDDVSVILATIRQQESGDNYTARNAHATASGAYQFVDGTWRGLGGTDYPGTHDAAQAPPEEQDRIARLHVERILAATGGRVELVPVAWYVGDPYWSAMDQVPSPAGNTLTPREYQQKWLRTLERKGQECKP